MSFNFLIETCIIEPPCFPLGVIIKEWVLIQVIVEGKTFVFGYQSFDADFYIRTVL